jgi:molybdate transport system regulatory protein
MPTPIVRFRIDFNRDEAIGPGKIALLERIALSGSLSQAARDLKMSYRRAWQLLESANTAFLEKVALTSKGGRGGGGAQLTQFGRDLISSYRAFEEDVQGRAARHFLSIARQARQARKPPRRGPVSPVIRMSDR